MYANECVARPVLLFRSCAANATKIFAAFHQNFFILEDINKGFLAGRESPPWEESESSSNRLSTIAGAKTLVMSSLF